MLKFNTLLLSSLLCLKAKADQSFLSGASMNTMATPDFTNPLGSPVQDFVGQAPARALASGTASQDSLAVHKLRHTREHFEKVRAYYAQASAQAGTAVPMALFDDAEYFITMTVGSNSQKFKTVPDTGSSNIWVLGTNCTDAVACVGHARYDPSASTTAVEAGEAFDIGYGDGSDYYGEVYNDTVTVGGASVPA